jgi:hypothetical protein
MKTKKKTAATEVSDWQNRTCLWHAAPEFGPSVADVTADVETAPHAGRRRGHPCGLERQISRGNRAPGNNRNCSGRNAA